MTGTGGHENGGFKTDLLLSLPSAKCVGKAGVHKIIGIFSPNFPPYRTRRANDQLFYVLEDYLLI